MSDRAGQFGAFAALKGYYDLIAEKGRVKVNKRELSEYEMECLSKKVLGIKCGKMIKVEHYCEGEYILTEGMVSRIDFISRKLMIVKTEISLDDILDVSGEGIPEEI